MLELKKLTLESKPLFDKYLKNKYENSEASFANMYIWKDFYKTKFAVVEDFLVVFNYPPNDGEFCYMPYGNGDLEKCLAKLKQDRDKPLTIVSASKTQAKFIKEYFPETVVKENIDFYDYVYLTQNLITLSGRKLRSKRNHLNNFKDRYSYTYRPMTKDDFMECTLLAKRLILNTRSEDSISYIYEMKSIETAFSAFDELELCGGVIEIDGKIAAFTVGEALTDDCALIHIEKADIAYDGIYAAINNEFVKNRWSDYTYINREEDMGIEGLRKAKLSYRPDHMVEKYFCIL